MKNIEELKTHAAAMAKSMGEKTMLMCWSRLLITMFRWRK